MVDQSLEHFFSACRQGSVVDKDGLSNGDVPDLGLGSESGQVEQSAIRLSVQVDSVFVLAEGGGQEHQEEAPKEGGGEHAAQLDSTTDVEWV